MGDRRAEWTRVIEQFEASGESHKDFCARRGLTLGTFRLWLYRLRKESRAGTVARSATRMVPVHVRASVARDEVIEVVIAGAMLRVLVGTDTRYVAELATALASRC
jgi:hypothetical protein